ncbi:MAG: cryptochrome/photolyase family protein [SAR116 cluster bacterium]|nr:cryptochrome/photolyase family protein [SAR116 cluster bacterium]
MANLILILGDQISPQISSLKAANKSEDIVLMAELRSETGYVKHHKKKIALLFSAMRHFAHELTTAGWQVDYHRFDPASACTNFTDAVQQAVNRHNPGKVIVTKPGEYRLAEEMSGWADVLPCAVSLCEDDRFFATTDEFAAWAEGRKQLRMEYFYREMRRKTGLLMQGDEPVGGQWNYDADNRQPPKDGLVIPPPTRFTPDDITKDVLALVEAEFSDHFGDLQPFDFAVTADQARQVLDEFIAQRLPQFGSYQDAMLADEPFMFHAHIGFYLNCGLLSPLEAVTAAEHAYFSGSAPLNAVEGFIRQILGWREYVRGLYWLKMPEYKTLNHLNATRPLPSFFWTADTDMRCLKTCVQDTRKFAYAHHIQRLMVLGNFALLAGLHPDEVNEWYLIVYADAYEWVELPNVSGMVLYADGGLLASKPYAAGGAYIDRMSDYCSSCRYKVKQKNGPDACPFNYLYWDFLIRHREKLNKNPRLGMIYRTLDKMGEDKQNTIRHDAALFLDKLS